MRRKQSVASGVFGWLPAALLLVGWAASFWFVGAATFRRTQSAADQVILKTTTLSSCEGGFSFVSTRVPVSSEFEDSDRLWHHWPLDFRVERVANRKARDRYFESPNAPHPLGFQMVSRALPRGARIWAVAVPFWAVFGVALIMPLRRVVESLRKALRQRRGRCPCCGYDMRASKERCPECGVDGDHVSSGISGS